MSTCMQYKSIWSYYLCTYTFIYASFICVCVSMYSLRFADRLVLAMLSDSHTWMGDASLCTSCFMFACSLHNRVWVWRPSYCDCGWFLRFGLVCMLGIVLYIHRWVLSVYSSNAFVLFYSTILAIRLCDAFFRSEFDCMQSSMIDFFRISRYENTEY